MQLPDEPGVGLPRPDEESARHSSRVAIHIERQIGDAGGSISFARFMHEALYAPGLGYYQAGNRKFGSGGDFVTAPEISPVFGRVLARSIQAVLEQVEGSGILELGAGSGAMALAILQKLAELGHPVPDYRILEVSPELAERQRTSIAKQSVDRAGNVQWLSDLPRRFRGVVIANEVADALPVERFRIRDGQVLQARVAADDDGFVMCFEPAPDPIVDAVRRLEASLGRRFEDGYESELSPALGAWVASLVQSLERGLVLLFDYGVSRREYYAVDRDRGWLRCHFRHFAHDNPLILPGIQDITSWVDFTAIAEAAVDAGAEVEAYLTQADFLLAGGLEQELDGFAELPVVERVRLSREVKLLTLPAEMGVRFKLIALRRGDVRLPDDFHPLDRAAEL